MQILLDFAALGLGWLILSLPLALLIGATIRHAENIRDHDQ